MGTFLPNLLDWDVYSEVVRRVLMIRVCTELETKMKGKLIEINSPAYQADRGDEYCVFTHPARSILDDGCRLCPTLIDRIVGVMVLNGLTYCIPSRYYLGGKLLRPGVFGKFGMCVWFGREDREKLLLEMGDMPSALTGGWSMNDARKKIHDYLVTKE